MSDPKYGSLSSTSNSDKIKLTQSQVNEVVEIMRDNLNKVIDRDNKLEHLESQSEELRANSHRFAVSSKRLKMRMWCQDKKMILILVFVLLLLIIIIALIIAYK